MKKLLLTLTVAITGTIAFGALRAVTPANWASNTNYWKYTRHLEKLKQVKAGGAPIVFIGDSITHFWETSGRAVWDQYFSGENTPYRALNLGTGGDRTEDVLWRITEGGELDGYSAKVILLMIGTNNTGHFPADKETPIDTILGVREILSVIRAKQPTAKIVLTAIFPRGPNVNDPLRLRNEVVNKEICKFADGRNIFWLDFNDQMLTTNGDLLHEVFPDLLHPAKYGYELWFAAVKPYIDYALSDGKLPAPANRYGAVIRSPKFGNQNTAHNPATRINEANASRGKDWWSRRLLEKRSQIVDSDGHFDLVMFGDSITHFWEYPSGTQAYAALTNRFKVLNIGYGGDRTEHLIWRGLNGELDGYKAKYFMLMIGTNNGDAPNFVAEGIKRILKIIAEKHPESKTLLLPIFPRDKVDSPSRAKRNQVNDIIKGYADGKKVIWLDFNRQLMDEQGNIRKYFHADLLHPNDAGYDVWLKAILPIIGK